MALTIVDLVEEAERRRFVVSDSSDPPDPPSKEGGTRLFDQVLDGKEREIDLREKTRRDHP